ncbi:hypothetical protein T265_12803, partial [Opisthorchis viverrini]
MALDSDTSAILFDPHNLPSVRGQKPNPKASVLGWKCKHITIFTERVAIHVPTPNLEGRQSVCQTSNHGLTWYERLCGDARIPSGIAKWVAKVRK